MGIVPIPCSIITCYNMNVRIGNDIRLNVTLASSDINMTNIKHLRCYLVNVTQKEVEHCDWGWYCQHEDHDHCEHGCGRKRYPVEPHCKDHRPGKYLLHSCGGPTYYAHPANCYKPGYTCDPAFGPALMPKPCHCCHCHNHHCHECFEHYEHLDGHYMGCDRCDHVGSCCGHDYDKIDLDYKYLTDTNLVESINKIQCYFPAQDQYLCGGYKFVVVMTVYEPGWGCRNLHTYTFDYGIVFNLVEDGYVNGVVEIDLGINAPTQPAEPEPTPEITDNTVGGYIFFDAASNFASTHTVDGTLNTEDLTLSSDVFTTTGVQNLTGEAAYLYIITKKPVTKITSSFGIPFGLTASVGDLYVYRSGNRVVPGFSDKITVK